jgi:carbon-monoxide dehydrogenase medium subunit
MTARDFISVTTVEQALSALSESGGTGKIIAGATWLMRAPLRGEDLPATAISISEIRELCQVEIGDDRIFIGAGVTHAQLANALRNIREFRGLVEAAGKSANPAIRSEATIGGNLCTPAFAAADLVPALLCLGAEVEYRTANGISWMSLEEFLSARRTLGGGLVTRVGVPRGKFRSAHARLPLRKAGDYPVAIVSVKAEQRSDGNFNDVRIAVGSVEETARRWHALEALIAGRNLAPSEIGAIAKEIADGFSGRDGVEAPGWYRVQVLPALVRRAFESLAMQEKD